MQRRIAFAFLISVGSLLAASALDNSKVVTLVKTGLDEATIVATINSSSAVDFKTDAETLISLKEAGVPNAVLSAMVARNSGGKPAAAPAQASVPASAEEGVYILQAGSAEPLMLSTEQPTTGATKLSKKEKLGSVLGIGGVAFKSNFLNSRLAGTKGSQRFTSGDLSIVCHKLPPSMRNQVSLILLQEESGDRVTAVNGKPKTVPTTASWDGSTKTLVLKPDTSLAPGHYAVTASIELYTFDVLESTATSR